jgi:hypothetical protein
MLVAILKMSQQKLAKKGKGREILMQNSGFVS